MHYIACALASQSRTVVEMGSILTSMKYAVVVSMCMYGYYISGASTTRLAFTVIVRMHCFYELKRCLKEIMYISRNASIPT